MTAPDENGWYDINHKKPFLYQECMFWNGKYQIQEEYAPKEWQDGFYIFDDKITHWKPLGPPPVGAE